MEETQQRGQDSRERTARTGLPGTGQPSKDARTGQAGQDSGLHCQERIAMKGQPGKDSQDGTFRRGQPGHDNLNRTTMLNTTIEAATENSVAYC
jgi:hypothetical protein